MLLSGALSAASADLSGALAATDVFTTTLSVVNPSNTQQVVFNCNDAVAGKYAGRGSTTIGPQEQIGFVVDDPPTQGTYVKGLIYANSFESMAVSAICSANRRKRGSRFIAMLGARIAV